ncbi:MAG: helix-turn-helix domain-containing protein [Bacteroidales bacterium]|nr:helix-turn-helix domain-containing protein [Bacteroidales bacterium]
MEKPEVTIHEFLSRLAFKINDNAFEETVLKQIKEIKNEMATIRQECLDYQEMKYFDEFIPIPRIPELLKNSVSKRTVESWISRGLFSIIQIGKIRFVKRVDFDRFMNDHEIYKNNNH